MIRQYSVDLGPECAVPTDDVGQVILEMIESWHLVNLNIGGQTRWLVGLLMPV